MDLVNELKNKLWNMKITQIEVGALREDPKGLGKKTPGNWKSDGESRPSRLQDCDWLEYSEESWKPKVTYCHPVNNNNNNTNGSPNLGLTTRPSNNQQQQKRRACRIVDFVILVDYRAKLIESAKKNKYLNLARELKKNGGTWRWKWY